MKALFKTGTLQVHISILLICIVSISSCSKKTDFIEDGNARLMFHETIKTKADHTEICDYLITKDMVRQYLMGFDCYKDSIESIISYPSELNNLLYLVSFNDGWKIIPSDSRFGVVLVESDEGTLNISQEFENEHFKAWLTDIMRQIEGARGILDSFGDESVHLWDSFRARDKSSLLEEIRDNQIVMTRSLDPGEPIWGKVLISTSNSTTIIENKDHLLQTKWGQDYPWNKSMPMVDSVLCVAGCSAVAIAQVLYYYHNLSGVPSGLYHSILLTQYNSNRVYGYYDSFNVYHTGYYQQGILSRSNYVYNSSHWSEMPLTDSGGTDEQYRYVSDLMLDIGVRIGMYYSPGGSSPLAGPNSYYDISSCFSSVNWTQYESLTDRQTVMTGLAMDDPTIISSRGYENDVQVGHSWVIDGYQKCRYYRTNIYAWYPIEELPDDALVCELKNEDYLLSIYPDLYSGMPVVQFYNYDEVYFRMNWGCNGNGDSYLYSSYPSSTWQDIYSFDKGIHYNFFPGELLIQ